MSEPCRVCCKNTRVYVCSTCKVKVHYQCWSKYIIDKSYKEKTAVSQIKCPQCGDRIQKHPMVTRSKAREALNRGRTISTIRHLLDKCGYSNGSDMCKKNAKNLFEYLLTKKEFVLSEGKFHHSVKTKLIQLYHLDKWEYARYMYMQMFGEEIPTIYIDIQ